MPLFGLSAPQMAYAGERWGEGDPELRYICAHVAGKCLAGMYQVPDR